MSQEQFDYESGATLQAEYEYQYEYKMPFVVMVKYQLHSDFRGLVGQLPECKVVKVIEIKTCELLQYWIECPKEAEEQINDMAFMTFIKNPDFQKYYRGTKAFQELIKAQSDESNKITIAMHSPNGNITASGYTEEAVKCIYCNEGPTDKDDMLIRVYAPGTYFMHWSWDNKGCDKNIDNRNPQGEPFKT